MLIQTFEPRSNEYRTGIQKVSRGFRPGASSGRERGIKDSAGPGGGLRFITREGAQWDSENPGM
jgi:hypothetical protein